MTDPAPRSHRTVDDLDHDELATLVREHLLAGHLIDRAGMPTVIPHGLDVMRDIAIDEWMGASPVYTKRMQRLLNFVGDTVETVFKGMQLDVGAPPEFLDFRYTVIDDHHGEFHLDHCGALMDVEPMGDDYVRAMCHDIEDPTFDATGWATNPRVQVRPVHRPPRVPADRQPHCAWTVSISDDNEARPEPERAVRIAATLAAQLPIASHPDQPSNDGLADYSGPLDGDLQVREFCTATLRGLLDEVCLQGHLLVLSFLMAVEDRFGTEAAVAAGSKQFAGVAGVAADRLRLAFGLGDSLDDVATVFELHPAFHPRGYVALEVSREPGALLVALGDAPALQETGFESWMSILADGHDRSVVAIARAVNPRAVVEAVSPRVWRVSVGHDTHPELDEVLLTRFSTGAAFEFRR